MLLAHRTLQPDSQVTTAVALRDLSGRCRFVIIAQGTSMHILDPLSPGCPFIESYPFQSPIAVLAPAGQSRSAVFVLLRNRNWFIFHLPCLIRFDSLSSSLLPCQRRSLLGRSSLLSAIPAGSTPVATALVHFVEGRICSAAHPQYVAIHFCSDAIHVIPVDGGPIIQVAVIDSNVVDLAFIGPMDGACRLVYLAESQASSRAVHLLSFVQDRSVFCEEFCVDVPSDAHSLLPIQASLIVFTRNGVVMISAPQGMQPAVAQFPVFLPGDGVILAHCHLRDDIYLMCDSCGGLTAGLFPIDGRPRTEFMKHIGAACALAGIDDRRFIVAAPFGDSLIYECRPLENGFELTEIRRIQGNGPIVQMSAAPGGVLCATGKGDSGRIQVLNDSVRCTPVAEISVGHCQALFIVDYEDFMYICMCFCNGTHFVMFDGFRLKQMEFDFCRAECALDLTKVEAGLLLITERFVRIFDPTNCKIIVQREFSSAIVAASHCTNHIAIADQVRIRILSPSQLTTEQNCKITKPPFLITVSETSLVVVSVDNRAIRIDLNSLAQTPVRWT
jgi:hypothetical protein